MLEQLRRSVHALCETTPEHQLDACVECGTPSPPGTNRCPNCLDRLADD